MSSKQSTDAKITAATPVNFPSFVFHSVCISPEAIEAALAGTYLTMEDFEDPAFRLDLPTLQCLISNLIEHTGDPHVWVRQARSFKVEYLGLVVQAAMNAPRLVDGIKVLNRYAPIAYPKVGHTFDPSLGERDAAESEISFKPVVDFAPHEYSHVGAALVVTNRVLNEMLRSPSVATRIEFALDKPEGWDAFAPDMNDTFIPVQFGGIRNRLVFPKARLDEVLPGADPINHKRYIELCDKIAAEIVVAQTPVEQVLQYLSNCGDLNVPLSTAASALGFSERSLRRHLERANTSFRRLKDEVREQRARALLRKSDLSIQMIAFQLGYEAPSNFARSFKRWTGLSPKAFRDSGSKP
ncbi:MAG: helix-turn-helix domain-containing protein [Pseudomonadota bacterium]